MRLPAAVLLILSAAATPAAASSDLVERILSANDRERLAAHAEVRASAVAKARRDGDPGQVADLDAILAGTPQPLRGETLVGDYRCRIAKLDGVLPVIVYGWFRCRVEEDDLGYRLLKTTGSQRTSLRFVDDGESRVIAYGAAHFADEAPLAYGADPERDQVGYLVKPEGGRYRIEFPLPRTESRFDILELERR